MSSVSPSEGNLAQYYQKSFSNLEDQHKNELKKNQNKREEELERLKNNYSQSLEKKDKDTEDVFQYTRDASKQALDKEKDKYRSTVEQLKENAANTLNETQTSLNKQSKTDINRVESQLEDNHDLLGAADNECLGVYLSLYQLSHHYDVVLVVVVVVRKELIVSASLGLAGLSAESRPGPLASRYMI